MTLVTNSEELRSRYAGWETGEIMKLLFRGGLEGEAEAIAREVLLSRGLNPEVPASNGKIELDRPAQTALAKRLWKSALVAACQFSFALLLWMPTHKTLKQLDLDLGAIWLELLAVGVGFVGYRVGYIVTKSICADDQKTYQAKRGELIFLLCACVVSGFLLALAVGALGSQ